ncbi:hypothetical protein ACFLYN_02750 [Chloroflexota bacterium]
MHYISGRGCGHHAHQGHGGTVEQSGGCGCHSGQGFRRFPNREEQLSHLEEYLKALQAEAKGVEERMTELKK